MSTTVPAELPPAGELQHERTPGADHIWVLHVTALSVALGILLALTMRTQDRIRTLGLPSNRHGIPASTLARYRERNEKLEQEVAALQEQVRKVRASQLDENRATELRREQLAAFRAFAGYGAAEGPGVRIRLRDSPAPRQPGTVESQYWVSDVDVNGLVSELRAAGAEGFALKDASGHVERFVLSTTVQQQGRALRVNGRLMEGPKNLRGALELPDGIIDNRGLSVLQMITIEEAPRLVLPAYVPRSNGLANAAAANQ
jgi:uncharacterized protein YlxW (UPF0749 family)